MDVVDEVDQHDIADLHAERCAEDMVREVMADVVGRDPSRPHLVRLYRHGVVVGARASGIFRPEWNQWIKELERWAYKPVYGDEKTDDRMPVAPYVPRLEEDEDEQKCRDRNWVVLMADEAQQMFVGMIDLAFTLEQGYEIARLQVAAVRHWVDCLSTALDRYDPHRNDAEDSE